MQNFRFQVENTKVERLEELLEEFDFNVKSVRESDFWATFTMQDELSEEEQDLLQSLVDSLDDEF